MYFEVQIIKHEEGQTENPYREFIAPYSKQIYRQIFSELDVRELVKSLNKVEPQGGN